MKNHLLPRSQATEARKAFTLVEILVASAVFVLFITLLFSIVSYVTQSWLRSEDFKNRNQVARIALERIARDLEGVIFPIDPADQTNFQFVVNPGFANIENPDSLFFQTILGASSNSNEIYEVGYFIRWSQISGSQQPALYRIQVPSSASDSIFKDAAAWLSAGKINEYGPDISSDPESFKGLLAANVVGLWITLYAGSQVLPVPYDSRATTSRPTSIEIGLAVADSRVIKRLTSAAQVTSGYSASNIDDFVSNLPSTIRPGVQIFKTRILMETAR